MIPIVTDKEIMHLSTAHNFMEIMTETEEKVEEESISTEPMEDRSTRMREVTYCSILMATPSMSPSIHKQFMLSSHQLWTLLEQQLRTEVELLQKVIEEPTEVEDSDKPEVMIKDSNQTEEQTEEQQGETTKTLAEDSVEDKNPTEDPKDHTITDRDPTEARGEVPTIDREVEGLSNLVKPQIGGTV